jgi:hypothetical protein
MLGYGEIQADPYSSSQLMDVFEREFNLKKHEFREIDFEYFTSTDAAIPFLGAVLRDKSHVYMTLREFLRKERILDE